MNKFSGRRNRGKQKDISQHNAQLYKDNHNNINVIRSSSPLPSQQQPEQCESCSRFEIELKKMRSEISHLKHTENELRQKCDHSSNVKSCLQAKQKENDELEKR